MTRFNDIHNSYGRPFSVIAANTYASNVLQLSGIVDSAMVIASPYDKESGEDIGPHSLLLTDFNGDPARLTYDFKEGNGLVFKDDALMVSTDEQTMFENDGTLAASLAYSIDNYTITSKNGKVQADSTKLDMASVTKFGLAKVDGSTVVSDNGKLIVETSALDLADSNVPGIAGSDGLTTSMVAGVLSVNTDGLQHATENIAGTIEADGSTLLSNDGVVMATHESLAALRSNAGHRLAKADGSTIVSNNGIISVDSSAIPYASQFTYGTVKVDERTLYIDNMGVLHPKSTQAALAYIYDYNEALGIAEDKVSQLKDIISEGLTPREPQIYSVSCNETTATALAIPEYLEEPIYMPVQHIYVSLNIVTNCDFNIAVRYDTNEPPVVELQDINYSNEITKQGVEAIDFTWPGTKMKEKNVILLFNAKNFSAGNLGKTLNTKITITVAADADRSVKKEVIYSVLRYNSLYTKEELLGEGGGEGGSRKYMEVLPQSFWYITDEDNIVTYYDRNMTMAEAILANICTWLTEPAPTASYLITRDMIRYVEDDPGRRIRYYGVYEDNLENFYRFNIDKIPTSRFGSSLSIGKIPIYQPIIPENGLSYFSTTLIYNVDEEDMFYPVKYESAPTGRVSIKPREIEVKTGRESSFRIYQILEDSNEVQTVHYYAMENSGEGAKFIWNENYIPWSFLDAPSKTFGVDENDHSYAKAPNNDTPDLVLRTSDTSVEFAYAYYGKSEADDVSFAYFCPYDSKVSGTPNLSLYKDKASVLKVSYTAVKYNMSMRYSYEYEGEQVVVPSYIRLIEGIDPTATLESYMKMTYEVHGEQTSIDLCYLAYYYASYMFPVDIKVWSTYEESGETKYAYFLETPQIDPEFISYDSNRNINTYFTSDITYFDGTYDTKTYMEMSFSNQLYAYTCSELAYVTRRCYPRLVTDRIHISSAYEGISITIDPKNTTDAYWPESYYPTYMLMHYFTINTSEALPIPNLTFREYNSFVIEGNDNIVRIYSYNIGFDMESNTGDTIKLIGKYTDGENPIVYSGYGSEYSPNASSLVDLQNNKLVIAYSYNYNANLPSACIGYYIADDYVDKPTIGTYFVNYGKSINGNYTIGWSYAYIANKSWFRLDQVNGAYLGNSPSSYFDINDASISYWCAYNLVHEHEVFIPDISGNMDAFECVAVDNKLVQYDYAYYNNYDRLNSDVASQISYVYYDPDEHVPAKKPYKFLLDQSYMTSASSFDGVPISCSVSYKDSNGDYNCLPVPISTNNSGGNYNNFESASPVQNRNRLIVNDELGVAYIRINNDSTSQGIVKGHVFTYNDILKISSYYPWHQSIVNSNLGGTLGHLNIHDAKNFISSYTRERFYLIGDVTATTYSYSFSFWSNKVEENIPPQSKGGGTKDGEGGEGGEGGGQTVVPITGSETAASTLTTVSYEIPVKWETDLKDITNVVQKIMCIPVYMVAGRKTNIDLSNIGVQLDSDFNKALGFTLYDNGFKKKVSITSTDSINWNMSNEDTSNNNNLTGSLASLLSSYIYCRVKMQVNPRNSTINDAQLFPSGNNNQHIKGLTEVTFNPAAASNYAYVTMPYFGKFLNESYYMLSYYAGFDIPYFNTYVFDSYLTPYLYEFEEPAKKVSTLGPVKFKLKYKVDDNNSIDVFTKEMYVDKIYRLPYVPEPIPSTPVVEEEEIPTRGASVPIGELPQMSSKAEFNFSYNDLGINYNVQSLILGTTDANDANPMHDYAAWTQIDRLIEIDNVAYQSTMMGMVGIKENIRETEMCSYFDIAWDNENAQDFTIRAVPDGETLPLVIDTDRVWAYMYNNKISGDTNAHCYWWSADNRDFYLCYLGYMYTANEGTEEMPNVVDLVGKYPGNEWQYDLPDIIPEINTYMSYCEHHYISSDQLANNDDPGQGEVRP